nr:retrovirus-related Pol polyprotein from transposon TNT 1-94 [Tanacetum cinerariifolium]
MNSFMKKKPDLPYFHVFGALCYPTNDGEDPGKLKSKADIRIFIGYAHSKKDYQIYNRRTRLIMETIHVEFDEMTAMASKQFGTGAELQIMTPRTISSRFMQNPFSTTPYLQTNVMWSFFNAFLTFVEPNNFKEAFLESSWIKALQEEIHEFERLDVWKLVPCLDLAVIIKLKWIFNVKQHEFGGRGNILIQGTCLKCNSGTGNSFTYDAIPVSFDEVQIIPNPPPQCHFNIYLCQICERNSHYGYECSQRVPLVYEPEPCYTQNFSDNDYSQDLPGVNPLIDHHCCYKCGNSLKDFFFHQCTCEFCENGAHVGYNCPAQVPSIQTLPSFPQQYPCCEDCRGFPEAYHCQPSQYTVNHPIFNILVVKIVGAIDIHKLPVCYDDDDDEEISNSLKDNIISRLPSCAAITPISSTEEPVDSLIMEDEHLDTISATKLDEFIKSSVEDLVPNPSESEHEHECDVPACEDFTTFSNILFDTDYDFYSSDDQSFSDEDVPKKIFLNPLFDEEIISMKTYPHHFNAESDLIESLFNHDSLMISSSSKIDSLFDEFVGELTLLKLILPGINETDCDPEKETHFIKRLLYDNSSPRPSKEFVSENSDAAIESFSPFPIPIEDSDSLMEEIDLSFTPDDPMPPGTEEDDYDSERDFLIFEELLSNNSLSLPENESFHFDITSSSRPPAKPPDGNTGILNIKMMGDISKQKVPMPRLMITLFLNKEKSLDLLSHLGHEAFQPSSVECSMMIYGKNTPNLDVPCFHFYPP